MTGLELLTRDLPSRCSARAGREAVELSRQCYRSFIPLYSVRSRRGLGFVLESRARSGGGDAVARRRAVDLWRRHGPAGHGLAQGRSAAFSRRPKPAPVAARSLAPAPAGALRPDRELLDRRPT